MSNQNITNTIFENFPTPIYLGNHGSLIATFENDLFSNCQSSSSGGAIYLTCSGGIFRRCCFSSCSSSIEGHAIYIVLSQDTRNNPNHILECCIYQCSSEKGEKGIFSRYGDTRLEETNFSNCRCSNNVYYLYYAIDTSIGTRCAIMNNTAIKSSIMHLSENTASHSFILFCDNTCLSPNSQHMYTAYILDMTITDSVFFRNKSPHCLLGWKSPGSFTVKRCYIDPNNEVAALLSDVKLESMLTSSTELNLNVIEIDQCTKDCKVNYTENWKVYYYLLLQFCNTFLIEENSKVL